MTSTSVGAGPLHSGSPTAWATPDASDSAHEYLNEDACAWIIQALSLNGFETLAMGLSLDSPLFQGSLLCRDRFLNTWGTRSSDTRLISVFSLIFWYSYRASSPSYFSPKFLSWFPKFILSNSSKSRGYYDWNCTHLFILKKLFIYLFLAVLGLRCFVRPFSSCGEWGLLFVAVRGLFIAVASLVAEHGL